MSRGRATRAAPWIGREDVEEALHVAVPNRGEEPVDDLRPRGTNTARSAGASVSSTVSTAIETLSG